VTHFFNLFRLNCVFVSSLSDSVTSVVPGTKYLLCNVIPFSNGHCVNSTHYLENEIDDYRADCAAQ